MADETTWTIDPDSLYLIPSADRKYTASEFANQAWPPCPVCGVDIRVFRIDAQAFGDEDRKFIPRQWRCPQACAGGWARPSQT